MSLSSLSPVDLAHLIQAVPVQLNGVSPIARAISTAGGIAFDELDSDFMLRRVPGVFAAGEMLDWEAPTGGYLLQASFATGAAAGRGVLKWLSRS
jgi:predicted flavoprotein YhiN